VLSGHDIAEAVERKRTEYSKRRGYHVEDGSIGNVRCELRRGDLVSIGGAMKSLLSYTPVPSTRHSSQIKLHVLRKVPSASCCTDVQFFQITSRDAYVFQPQNALQT
jgi:hypothetical protein